MADAAFPGSPFDVSFYHPFASPYFGAGILVIWKSL